LSSTENFVSQVCDAFRKATEKASRVTLEGREREFRRVLSRHLFDEVLGWEGYSEVGEIRDITCFDNENFPIIIVETKWGVELTREIKEKLRRRIEELGSVKYGVFASEREFIIYVYEDYELKEITNVNVAEAVGKAREEFGLSEVAKKRILKLELLKRERLVWIEDTEYFEKAYKEISVAKREGGKFLTENLKDIVSDLTAVLINFFDSYCKRKDHSSGKFLENTFNDWLKISMKEDEFRIGDETKRRNIVEVFCKETAYVLVGRILFTRICEDKDIIERMISGKGIAESLKYYVKRGIENVYLHLLNESREKIRKYYRHLHELGFFDWWLIEEVKRGTLSYDDSKIQEDLEKDLDYGVKKVFRRLNRFDFTQVNRDILGDVYQGYLPPEERKRLGEFYTPKEIIEYILDAVGYKPENEIRGKKILDPACGSGSFLVEATQRLIEQYRRIGFSLKDSDDAKQIIEGCIGSICGLDIHPFACFIAEMNLMFQLVDLYDVVRQKYKYYELPRLRIYRTDSLAPSEETGVLTNFFDNSRLMMLIEETRAANLVKGDKFDYVVGNPPYVRKERISADYKERTLAKIYPEVYHGDNDICVYFVTHGVEWLKENGKLGYIVSGKFTKVRYGEKLRKYIPNNCRVEQFLDLRGVQIFRDVTNDPIILILGKETGKEKRERNNVKSVYVKKEKPSAEELMKHIRENIGKEWHTDDFIDIFNSQQAFLIKESWKLVPTRVVEVFKKIEKESDYPLKNVCDVFYGIKPGRVDVFVVDEKKIEELKLERDLLKPVLRGEDVRKYRIDYKDMYLVFPYIKDENGNYVVVDIENFPLLERYLIQFKEELKNRYDIRRSKSRWYELRPCHYYYVFETEKILTPDISMQNNFSYDKTKYYCLDTCFTILPRKEYRQYAYYYLGLLNSKTLEFYFKQIGGYLGKKGYRYKKQYLDQLPIKEITSENKHLASEIIQTVDRILLLNEQSSFIKKKLGGFPYSYFENGWRFDKLVNVVKAQTLSQPSYTILEDSPRTDYLLKDLDGGETFRIIFAHDEYIDFHDEYVASYVFEVLKTMKSVTKRELLELKSPAKEYLRNLMTQYRKDKEEIVKSQKAVDDLEKQIDELVYKLYNISYAERRIIEDYLTKF